MATTALQMTMNPMHGAKIRNGNTFNDSPKKALNGTALKPFTGKKKLVKRDPITGEGAASKEPNDFGRNKSEKPNSRRAFNDELIKWNPDEAVSKSPTADRPKSSRVKSALERNPVSMQGDLGKEVDSLMTTSKPRAGTPRDPVRNPINGQGNFGNREWDPVWKYVGKVRRAKSTTNEKSNPLIGNSKNGYIVSVEERNNCMTPKSYRPETAKNVLTGENCDSYTVSTELKEKSSKRDVVKRNAVTGENCQYYEVNIENVNKPLNRSSTMNTKKTNPLLGENMASFDFSVEQRPRSSNPYLYSNTVTGENRASYKITPNERNISARSNSNSQNPLNGDNVKSYTYRADEKCRNIKKREINKKIDIASPLTGDGSRGQTYSVSIEERRKYDSPSTPNSARNILTGENCQTYMVSQEMRSERKTNNLNSGFYSPQPSARPLRVANYNIITGETN